jgi:hypothetical protein
MDPVPGLTRGEEIETAITCLPLLDGARLDRDTTAAGDHRHAGVGFEAEDFSTAGDEEAGGDAGAASHVEHGSRTVGHEGVDQLGRVRGSNAVVLLRVVTE